MGNFIVRTGCNYLFLKDAAFTMVLFHCKLNLVFFQLDIFQSEEVGELVNPDVHIRAIRTPTARRYVSMELHRPFFS